MIEITIRRPDGPARKAAFEQSTIRIGRDASNDIVLDAQGCSRHHAEIRFHDGQYKLVDLGSTNGVMFGNAKVPELLLFDGAEVDIGESTLSFRIAAADPGRTVFLRREDLGAAPAGPSAEPAAPAAPAAPAQPREIAPPPAATPPPAAAETEGRVLYLLIPRGKKVENFKVAQGVSYTIGRSPNADIVLDDKKSSLEHARISSRGGHFYVRDLGSSNGTLLRGQPIEEAEISDGDTFVVGDTPLTLSATRYDLSDEAVLMDKTQASFRISSKDWEEAGRGKSVAEAAGSGFERLQGLSRGRTIGLVLIVLLLAGAAGWFLLGPRRTAPAADTTAAAASVDTDALRVAVQPVRLTSLTDVIAGGGNVRPLEKATVSAEVGGRLLALNVSVGSTVARGAELARVSDTEIRLQLEEARSAVSQEQVDVAREDFERKQRLFDQGVVTRSVLDASRNAHLSLDSAFKTAQARIRQLEEQLAKTSIRAPLGGVVVRTFANAGEVLAPGSPIVEIENQSAVLVELEVSDRDVVRVSLGLPVRARVDAFPGRIFKGEVETVATTANPATKSFAVKARIDNADGSLRSGMNATVDIVLASREGLALPVEAFLDVHDDRAAVFEVVDGVAHRRSVTVGHRVDSQMEILGGAPEGALVVVSGQDRLQEGDVVSVYEQRD